MNQNVMKKAVDIKTKQIWLFTTLQGHVFQIGHTLSGRLDTHLGDFNTVGTERGRVKLPENRATSPLPQLDEKILTVTRRPGPSIIKTPCPTRIQRQSIVSKTRDNIVAREPWCSLKKRQLRSALLLYYATLDKTKLKAH